MRQIHSFARLTLWDLLRYEVQPHHEEREEQEEQARRGNKTRPMSEGIKRAEEILQRGKWLSVPVYLEKIAQHWEQGNRYTKKTETW